MRTLLKHRLLVGLIALLVVGGAGGAYAATQSANNPRQAFLNDVAKRLNVTPQQLQSAIRGAFLDRLEAAVKAGRLTQAQANQISQRLAQGGPIFPLPAPGFARPAPGFNRPLLGAGQGHGELAAAAQYLGLTDLQLFTDLHSGKTLAQIAQSRGKSVTGLEQALIANAQTRLDRMVAAGWLTKAQEQLELSRLKTRIAQVVNRARLQQPRLAGPPRALGFGVPGDGGPGFGAPPLPPPA